MAKPSLDVIKEWANKKKHISDRVNRIRKRLKKYNKQLAHFEYRLRLIKEFEINEAKSRGQDNNSR